MPSADDSEQLSTPTALNAETAGRDSEKTRSEKLLYEDVTSSIIGAFYTVYNKLGYGFLENVYSSALALELRRHGHHVAREVVVPVYYDGERIAHYLVDFVTDDVIALEVKSTAVLNPSDRRQLLNCLCGTPLDVGLLLHFGPKPTFHRLIAPKRFRRA